MKVGFIGLGNMGNPMAANVLAAGYDMTVYDIRREKGENLEADGATWGSSPKEVAGRSDVVFTSLPGPAEVEAVVLSNDGIFAGLNEGAAYVDTTTNAPATMRNIAEIGASRGFQVLDAPILAVKDMRLAVELGKELDVPLEVGLLVKDMITRFRDGGRGQDDITEIVGEFFQRSGVAFGEA